MLLEKLSTFRICFIVIFGDPFSDSRRKRKVFEIIIKTKIRTTAFTSYHVLFSSNAN